MTPKDKARKFVKKYLDLIPYNFNNGILDFSVKLSLIEIENNIKTIENLINLCNPYNSMIIYLEKELKELIEIRNEIEKL
jgi:hypothetical protein